MIVAAQHQRGAVLAGAGQVGMAEDVAGAIDARTFAVPDADHAVDLALADHVEDLAAHHGGGREILIHAGLEVDVVLVEQLARRAPEARS